MPAVGTCVDGGMRVGEFVAQDVNGHEDGAVGDGDDCVVCVDAVGVGKKKKEERVFVFVVVVACVRVHVNVGVRVRRDV